MPTIKKPGSSGQTNNTNTSSWATLLKFNKASLKNPRNFSGSQLSIFILIFAAVGGYLLFHSLAAGPLVASLEAEQMGPTPGAGAITDTTASAGKAMLLTANGTITGPVNLPSPVTSITVSAKGIQCQGAPTMNVGVDGTKLLSRRAVSSTNWAAYSANTNLNSGTHTLSISFTNDNSYSRRHNHVTTTCSRDLYVDVTNFYGPVVVTPAPTVALSASPTYINVGAASTLTWNSTNATNCSASGAWSGTQTTSGSASTGAVNQNSTYSLTCTGPGGSASGSAVVAVTSPPSASSSIYWGAYIEGVNTYGYYFPTQAPWSNAPLVDPGKTDAWAKFEADAGKKISLMMFGQANPWSQPFQQVYFDAVLARGAIPVVDMSTQSTPLGDITAGTYDAQITAWAQAAKNWGHPFFLRLDAEMNGTWYNYGAQARQNPAAFVAMWRHIHDIFTTVGANNVTWHWCPNIDPESVQTPLEQLYPGDAYVDWTGMTGYNQGNEAVSWLFDSTYSRLVTLAPNKPIQIGETGSVDANYTGQKVQFIQDFFSGLTTKYPKVRGFVWFNWRIDEGQGYWDWPIESSASGQAAFDQAIGSAYYQNGSQESSFPLNTKVPIP